MAGLQWYEIRTHDMPPMIRYLDHWATAAPMGEEEHCVPLVLAHYPVVIRLMARADCMRGPPAPTPQTCIVGCSMHQQSVLEGCRSELQSHNKLLYRVRTSVSMHNATVQ
ncbi:hypothetical protein TNCV_3167481 [Trichonephila clavipes]|uniref:Uncharacterized protein n=1 Tax=Trichonephila clavipes TaxID=2585209 RepID=A0A8X6V0N6_TRICX|nr:hypothetical protein TNCV_3167481 [Trichonephila clavipes]